MTLQQKLKQLGEALAGLSARCYHYWRPGMLPPYIVWQEDGEDSSFSGDNRKQEYTLSGTVDYYTPTEFDPMAERIPAALTGLRLVWALKSVQYEPETGLIHHEWTFEVV